MQQKFQDALADISETVQVLGKHGLDFNVAPPEGKFDRYQYTQLKLTFV